MRTWFAGVALIGILAGVTAAARTQQRSAAISGAVIDSDGRAIAKSVISLRDSPTNLLQTAVTDETGTFNFSGLTAGHYDVSAARNGYLSRLSSGTGAAATTMSIDLTAGEQRAGVMLRLMKAGTISGTVTDATGDPLSTSIAVIRLQRPGHMTAFSVAGAPGKSDSRGRYRVSGVLPGDYLVIIEPPPAIGPNGTVQRSVAGLFYPGVTTATDATFVHVGIGMDATNIDVRVPEVLPAQVTVNIDDGGRTLASRNIWVGLADQFPVGQSMAVSATTSRGSLAPGRYSLLGMGTDAGPPARVLWGSSEVTVAGGAPIDVSVLLKPGATLMGRVIYEGQPAPVPPIALVPVGTPGVRLSPLPWLGTWQYDGTSGDFSFTDVLPGRYLIAVGDPTQRVTTSLPMDGTRWALKSVTVGGRDVLDVPVDFSAGGRVSNVVVTFTDRPSMLSGTVLTPAGLPALDGWVVVFPRETRYWLPDSRRIRLVATDGSGRYSFLGLPAGEYFVSTTATSAALRLEPFLNGLIPTSLLIALSEGEQKTLPLRTPGLPSENR